MKTTYKSYATDEYITDVDDDDVDDDDDDDDDDDTSFITFSHNLYTFSSQ